MCGGVWLYCCLCKNCLVLKKLEWAWLTGRHLGKYGVDFKQGKLYSDHFGNFI